MTAKKQKYLKKKVKFQGDTLVMYSLDGDTWSTRKEELVEIVERHELQKQNFGGQIKGGPQVKTVKHQSKLKKPRKKFRKVAPVNAQSTEEEKVKEAPKKVAAKSKTKKKTAAKTKTKAKSKTKAKAKTKAKSKTKTKTKTRAKSKTKAKSKKMAEPKSRATGSPKKKTRAKVKKKRA